MGVLFLLFFKGNNKPDLPSSTWNGFGRRRKMEKYLLRNFPMNNKFFATLFQLSSWGVEKKWRKVDFSRKRDKGGKTKNCINIIFIWSRILIYAIESIYWINVWKLFGFLVNIFVLCIGRSNNKKCDIIIRY